MKCPYKPDLTPMDDRIKKLPVDKRGYPVPWFVAYVNGEPDFRIIGESKFETAVKYSYCWVCGDRLGSFKTFVVGPMCGLNRTSAEPPSHQSCAKWSAQNCPFLTRPNMKRREDELTQSGESAGIMIKRNPGVTLLWTTKSFGLFKDPNGGVLIEMGEPVELEWYALGKPGATNTQIRAAIDSGLPILREIAAKEGNGAMEALDKQLSKYMTMLNLGDA